MASLPPELKLRILETTAQTTSLPTLLALSSVNHAFRALYNSKEHSLLLIFARAFIPKEVFHICRIAANLPIARHPQDASSCSRCQDDPDKKRAEDTSRGEYVLGLMLLGDWSTSLEEWEEKMPKVGLLELRDMIRMHWKIVFIAFTSAVLFKWAEDYAVTDEERLFIKRARDGDVKFERYGLDYAELHPRLFNHWNAYESIWECWYGTAAIKMSHVGIIEGMMFNNGYFSKLLSRAAEELKLAPTYYYGLGFGTFFQRFINRPKWGRGKPPPGADIDPRTGESCTFSVRGGVEDFWCLFVTLLEEERVQWVPDAINQINDSIYAGPQNPDMLPCQKGNGRNHAVIRVNPPRPFDIDSPQGIYDYAFDVHGLYTFLTCKNAKERRRVMEEAMMGMIHYDYYWPER